MQRRHVVFVVVIGFVVLVGGAMLLIGVFNHEDNGIDTDTPNGHAPVGVVARL